MKLINSCELWRARNWYCHITVAREMEAMGGNKVWVGKREGGVTSEVMCVDERNELEMEMERGSVENVWRSVNVLSEHYSMN